MPARRRPAPWRPWRPLGRLGILGLLFLTAAPAPAQIGSAPEVATQRGDRPRTYDDLYQPNQEATGQDLILMARHEAFYVEAAVLGEYTTNAFLVDDARDDVLLLGSLRGGFASVVAERFSVVAELSAIAARYNRFSELSYDRLGGTLSAAVPLRGWQVGVAYEPSVIFDDGFDERQLTQHQFTLFADRQGAFRDDLGWFLGARGSRTFADPDDFDAWRASATAGGYWLLRPDLVLQGGLQIQFQHYDDYFEELTNDTRQDLSLTPFLGLRYQLGERADLALSLRYTHNESSLDPLDYDAAAVTPSLALTLRF